MENTKQHAITIDLNQFKLHIDLKNKIELTLHFNSPSRRFYLSLIAFVVNEMKRLGKITSIPLEGNLHLVALLNESVGGLPVRQKKRTCYQGFTENGRTLYPTWKKLRFLRSWEGRSNMTRALARPIPLPRLKKIAGQIFLSTQEARRMSG